MQQNNAQSLGEALRSLRHSQSLTQLELSERLGANLDSRYVRRIESGARMPDRTMLLRLVAALGLRDRNAIDQMLELTGQKATREEEFAALGERDWSAAEAKVPRDGALRCFQLVSEFQRTGSGQDDAPRYHDLVLEALTRIFETQLRKPVKEERLDEGRKRVDMVFNNVATYGFFRALRESHGVRCPYVFFECKNYAAELGNPAFDQLVGRFSDKSGLFGALVCRVNTDPALALKRCRDVIARNRGYVLVLDDGDITALLGHRAKGDEAAIDDYMDNLFRRLVL